MNVDTGYWASDERHGPIVTGLPPLASPGKKKKNSIHGHTHAKHGDGTDMLKLAIRNAGILSNSGSHENLGKSGDGSTSARLHNARSNSPDQTPRSNFEIILRHDSESDMLVVDDTQYDSDKERLSTPGERLLNTPPPSAALARELYGGRNSSRGSNSSYDFDSGISSLTSMSSTRSIIQISRSGPMVIQSRKMLNMDDDDDAPKKLENNGEDRFHWRSYVPSRLRKSFLRPRRHTDPPPVSMQAAHDRSPLKMIFGGRKKSQIYPDPDPGDCELESKLRKNQEADVLATPEASPTKSLHLFSLMRKDDRRTSM
jgi:hypothetical protein